MTDARTDRRRITVCVDTPGWFDPYAEDLVARVRATDDEVHLVREAADVPSGSIAFYLSCTRITPPQVLARNALNVVIHASALPQGRGFSPIVWQVLSGRSEIQVTMIEATEEVDAGGILMVRNLQLEGHELNPEIRNLLGTTIVAMCLDLVAAEVAPRPVPQVGEATWYPRRTAQDSRLDPTRSLHEQFNLLRVVDNERYPAFFDYLGHRYVLRIEKANASRDPDPDEMAGSAA